MLYNSFWNSLLSVFPVDVYPIFCNLKNHQGQKILQFRVEYASMWKKWIQVHTPNQYLNYCMWWPRFCTRIWCSFVGDWRAISTYLPLKFSKRKICIRVSHISGAPRPLWYQESWEITGSSYLPWVQPLSFRTEFMSDKLDWAQACFSSLI